MRFVNDPFKLRSTLPLSTCSHHPITINSLSPVVSGLVPGCIYTDLIDLPYAFRKMSSLSYHSISAYVLHYSIPFGLKSSFVVSGFICGYWPSRLILDFLCFAKWRSHVTLRAYIKQIMYICFGTLYKVNAEEEPM